MITAYPPLPIPAGVKPQRMPAYNIFGWFADSNRRAGVAFSGHFRVDPTTGEIEGQMVDIYGESEIAGVMTTSELRFGKKYCRLNRSAEEQRDREPDYSYLFSLDGDEWIGGCGSGTAHGPYQAACVITLVCEDASLMVWRR